MKNKITMTQSSWAFAISIFATAIASIFLATAMVINQGFLADEKTQQWVSSILAQLILLGSAIAVSIKNKIDMPLAIGAKNPVKAWQIALLIPLSFATICFMLPVQTAISNALAGLGLNAPGSIIVDNAFDLVLALVLIAVMPAICEESIYRGFVCNSMAVPGKKIDVKAIVVSSLLFALMHMSPWQFVHPFVLGCIIAFVYLATKSFWAAAVLHFSNNAFILLFGYFTKGAFDSFILSNWYFAMPLALAAILPIIWLYAKNATATEQEDCEQKQLRTLDRNKSLSCFVAGSVFCFVMFVYTLLG